MARVKRSVPSRAYRKKILELAKGYRGRSKNCYSVAIQKVEKGLCYAYRDRRAKKRDMRGMWIIRINAALRELGLKYSVFMNMMKKNQCLINRKMLANMAVNNTEAFRLLVKKVSDVSAS